MKKLLAVAAIAGAAGALAAAAPAAADDYALVNGDVLPCTALPWNWEGPVNVLSPSGEYNACQKTGVTHGG